MNIFLHHFLAWFLHSLRSVFGCALPGLPRHRWRLSRYSVAPVGAYWWNGYGLRSRKLRCACAYSAAYASRARRCALRCACALLSRFARRVVMVSRIRAIVRIMAGLLVGCIGGFRPRLLYFVGIGPGPNLPTTYASKTRLDSLNPFALTLFPIRSFVTSKAFVSSASGNNGTRGNMVPLVL